MKSIFSIVLVSLVSLIPTVFAAPDAKIDSPQFQFEDAQAAFVGGEAMARDKLVRRWQMVGIASSPSVKGDNDGYFADGEYRIDGQPGNFINVTEFRTKKNSLGVEVIEKVLGAESGKIYGSTGPAPAVFTLTGLVFENPGNKQICSSQTECRLSSFGRSAPMMLCSITNTDASCGTVGEIHRYVGFVKAALRNNGSRGNGGNSALVEQCRQYPYQPWCPCPYNYGCRRPDSR